MFLLQASRRAAFDHLTSLPGLTQVITPWRLRRRQVGGSTWRTRRLPSGLAAAVASFYMIVISVVYPDIRAGLRLLHAVSRHLRRAGAPAVERRALHATDRRRSFV